MSREYETHSDGKLSVVSVDDTCVPRKIRESLLYTLGTSDQPMQPIKQKQEGGKLITAASNNKKNNIQPIGLLSTLVHKASWAKTIPMAEQLRHVSIPSTFMPFSLRISPPFATRNRSPVPPMDP